MVHRGVARQVERERRLTHGGARRQDDQVRTLPAHGHAVDAGETRRHTVHTGVALHLLDVVHRGVDQAAYVLHLTADIALDGIVDLALRLVDQVVHLDRIVERIPQNVVRGRDQVALDRLLLEDLDIVFHVRRGPYLLGQVREHDGAAHGLQVAPGLELAAHRDDIDRGVVRDQAGHRLEDHPVLGIIETGGGELLHGEVHARRLQQHGTQDGLLDIRRLRRLVAELDA